MRDWYSLVGRTAMSLTLAGCNLLVGIQDVPDAPDALSPAADSAGDVTMDAVGTTSDGSTNEDVLDAGPTASDATDAVAIADAPANADSPPTCTGNQIRCGSACIDPTVDPNHCGGCDVVCSSGLCGTTVSAPMASSPSGWSFNGSAVWSSVGPSAQMTAAGAASVTGTVIYQHAIATDGFAVTFQFRIGAGGGGRYSGMGFMIEASGATAVGGPNDGLGRALRSPGSSPARRTTTDSPGRPAAILATGGCRPRSSRSR